MEHSFENLIEQFGIPKIIQPNTPRIYYSSDYHLGAGSNPDLQVEGRVFHRRYKHGETEFIAIKSRIEAYKRDEIALLGNLKKQNLKPVEFFYRYKGTRTWDYSTDHWEDDKDFDRDRNGCRAFEPRRFIKSHRRKQSFMDRRLEFDGR